MSTNDQSIQDKRQKNHLVYLLVSLLFILLVVPSVGHSTFANGLLRLGITAVLITAAVATRRRKSIFVVGIVGVAIVAPVNWMTLFIDQPILFVSSCIVEGLFFITMAVLILITVTRRHLATIHSIYGAISAYLLLGLAWAVVYWGIYHVDQTALDLAKHATTTNVLRGKDSEVAEFSQFVYFSFVTMSTLGYGDITPRSPITQTLTWMQSVTGQFYMAVLVAWMVSEIPRPSAKKTGTRSPA